jgi:hypothetical protein
MSWRFWSRPINPKLWFLYPFYEVLCSTSSASITSISMSFRRLLPCTEHVMNKATRSQTVLSIPTSLRQSEKALFICECQFKEFTRFFRAAASTSIWEHDMTRIDPRITNFNSNIKFEQRRLSELFWNCDWSFRNLLHFCWRTSTSLALEVTWSQAGWEVLDLLHSSGYHWDILMCFTQVTLKI